MGVAIGSSIQIALLVTPFLVMFGWAIGQPMSLHFETCEFWDGLNVHVRVWVFANVFGVVSTVAFAFSVLVVTYTVQDGRSNYLEGAMVCYFLPLLAWYTTDLSLLLASRSLLHYRPRLLCQSVSRRQQGHQVCLFLNVDNTERIRPFT